MKKTIVVFLMMCSSVQARQAFGLLMPKLDAAGAGMNNGGETNAQKPTNTEEPTATALITIEEHIYAVTNDAFAKIASVEE